MDWFDAPNEAALTLALQSSSAFIAAQEAAGGQGANATASPPPFVAPPFIAQVTVAPPPSIAPSVIAPVTWTPGAALMLAIAYGANLGGMGTKIGTVPNAQLSGFLREQQGIGSADGTGQVETLAGFELGEVHGFRRK